MKPQDARDYDRSLEMGNATSDGVAGRCISSQGGDGRPRVFAQGTRVLVSRCSLADLE